MDKVDVQTEFIHAKYKTTNNRAFFLDYDGTLVSFRSLPQEAAPDMPLKTLLTSIASEQKNSVVIISGREKETMEEWFGELPITLVAEHGAFCREPGRPWKTLFHKTAYWKDDVYPAFKKLSTQYPGSFVEEKQYSLAWHYRAVKESVTSDKAQILAGLRALQNDNDFLIYEEEDTIELRTSGVDKGRFAARYLVTRPRFDFILAIGDGRTDEDLFEMIGDEGITMRVGRTIRSSAKYYLESQKFVVPFLRHLISTSNN